MKFPYAARETTTTVGTGAFTLAGAVTGYQTLFSALDMLNKYEYYSVRNDSNSEYEAGAGYLSAAGTFERAIILVNSAGTSTPLNFSAGTKTIQLGPIGGGVKYPARAISSLGYKLFGPENWSLSSVSSGSDMTANSVYEIPWRGSYSGKVKSFAVDVTTAGGAGAKGRIGYYEYQANGNPDKCLHQTADIDLTTTGVKIASVTPFDYNGEDIYMAWLCNDSTVRLRSLSGSPLSGITGLLTSVPQPIPILEVAISAGWASMPDIGASTISITGWWKSKPYIMMEPA